MIEYILHTIMFSDLSYLFYGFLIIAFGGYFILAGGSFLYFYLLKKNEWMKKRIQEDIPNSTDIRREIFWSLSSTIIWIFLAIGIIVGVDQGVFQLYFKVSDHGVGYFVLSLIILIIAHDTYFYWCHRFMHSSFRIFKLFHRIHHMSKNPTPFAIHAFGPMEAILYALYVPLILLIVPIHIYALLLWFFVESMVNVLGHLGHELFPVKFRRSVMGKWINSGTHHNLHHRESRYGFGHYFNFWDRIMGTNHKDYERLLTQDSDTRS